MRTLLSAKQPHCQELRQLLAKHGSLPLITVGLWRLKGVIFRAQEGNIEIIDHSLLMLTVE